MYCGKKTFTRFLQNMLQNCKSLNSQYYVSSKIYFFYDLFLFIPVWSVFICPWASTWEDKILGRTHENVECTHQVKVKSGKFLLNEKIKSIGIAVIFASLMCIFTSCLSQDDPGLQFSRLLSQKSNHEYPHSLREIVFFFLSVFTKWTTLRHLWKSAFGIKNFGF